MLRWILSRPGHVAWWVEWNVTRGCARKTKKP